MARTFGNWLRTLGAPEDPVATDTSSEWSAMSLLKAIYAAISSGALDGATGPAGPAGPTGATGATGAAGPGYAATSVTSNIIASSGSKSFTTQSGLAYAAGARVRAADTSNPSTNYMEGVVTSYSGTLLAFTADRSVGSGTLTNWTINLAGDKGADGAGSGDFVGPASSTSGNVVTFGSTTGKLGADSGKSFSTDGTFASNSDAKVPTEAAVKTYADGLITALRNGVSAAFDTLAEIATALGGKLTAASNLSDLASAATAFTNIKQAATLTATGVVELATDAEARTGSSTSVVVTASNLGAILNPTQQIFTSSSGTYTTPANVKWLRIRMVGGGGGGSGGSAGGAGGTGGNTTFSTLTANGGVGGSSVSGGAGGTATGGDINISGGSGGTADALASGNSGAGGSNPLGAGGNAVSATGSAGKAGAGYGAGGGGASYVTGTNFPGGGGGSAGYVEKIISAPSATYSYAIGAAGAAGTAAASSGGGAAGTAGIVIVEEHYLA